MPLTSKAGKTLAKSKAKSAVGDAVDTVVDGVLGRDDTAEDKIKKVDKVGALDRAKKRGRD